MLFKKKEVKTTIVDVKQFFQFGDTLIVAIDCIRSIERTGKIIEVSYRTNAKTINSTVIFDNDEMAISAMNELAEKLNKDIILL